MSRTSPGRGVAAVVGLLLLATASRAEATGARVRWDPSPGTNVIGYHVYFRHAGTMYGRPPFDAGSPAPQADGSLAYVVSGLTAGQTYYFAVTAYSAGPNSIESSLSREIALGAANPCLVDHCTSPTACDIHVAADGSSCDDGLFCNGIAVCQGGNCENGPAPSCSDGVACTVDHCDEALARCVHVSQPGCCTTDAECLDGDACTSAEHCVAGTCVSLAAICPPSSCADAFCDPASGCGLMPTPDGVSCGDACGLFAVKKLALRATADVGSINLRGSFQTDTPVDPTLTGLTVEITGASGAVSFTAFVPPAGFSSRHAGTKFRYVASAQEAQETGGISGIVLKLRHGAWSLNVRGAAAALVDTTSQPYVAVTVRLGDLCVSDNQLTCEGDGGRARCS